MEKNSCCAGKGCSWKGKISDKENHEKTCDYVRVPCPNSCTKKTNEIVQVVRQELSKHLLEECPLRKTCCKTCVKVDTYENIVSHSEACGGAGITCTSCDKHMDRWTLEEHQKEYCRNAEMPCPYACGATKPRREMPRHLKKDIGLHFELAKKVVADVAMTDTTANPVGSTEATSSSTGDVTSEQAGENGSSKAQRSEQTQRSRFCTIL